VDASLPSDAEQVPSRYRVHLLPRAKPVERGVLYRRGDAQFLLEWSRVRRVLSAWVGAPGARSAVFDLVLEATGPECVVARVELAPGEDVARVARAVAIGLAGRAPGPGGDPEAPAEEPALDYPDVETFEAAALEVVRFRGAVS
jgi:hypothetical protein